MKASILVIGDELLGGRCRDTNSGWLCSSCASFGIEVLETRCGPDDPGWISRAISEMTIGCDLLLVTGGLGPTPDDLTREGLSEFLSDPLVVDDEAASWIESFFADADLEMGPSQSRLTMRPSTATCYRNHVGTAPAILSEQENTAIWLLPGPPRELHDAWQRHVSEWLSRRGVSGQSVKPVTVRCFGLIEASMEERLGSLASRSNRPLAGTRISGGEFHLHLEPCGADQSTMDACVAAAREKLKPYDFGLDSQSLSSVIGELLRARGERLSTAESCTSGLISSAMVDIPGSSEWFSGGWIVYSNEMKHSCLGVPEDLLASVGAVSREVVEALARNAIFNSGSQWSIAVSGIAGPDGGTPEKPVGTVWIACHGPGMEWQRRFRFRGDRATVRQRATAASLQLLRWCLDGHDPMTPMSWDEPS
ncbi:MAG: hypothetical protein CMJ40_00980 [Phycisphaerae bacterium]|nr:hypothetical protein [Phycisphaerae bacterium]